MAGKQGAKRKKEGAAAPRLSLQRTRSPPQTKQKAVEDELEIEDLASRLVMDYPAARKALMSWYVQCHRVLPWRKSPGVPDSRWKDPQQFAYAVFVSELMLHQTSVRVVVEYFEKWMQKWATIQDLAKASLEEVKEVIAGMGYYRRAGFLLGGAQTIVRDFNGKFPETIEQLQRIHGVGKSTSRAIASIVFGVPDAVPDGNAGNAVRTLSRLFAVAGDPKTQPKLFKMLADLFLDRENTADFNQAVMELGALVCLPNKPRCEQCPLQIHCRAYQNVLEAEDNDDNPALPVTEYPMSRRVAPLKEETVFVSVLQFLSEDYKEKWYLMLKRPTGGLLSREWVFPTIPLPDCSPEVLSSKEDRMDNYLSSISDIYVSASAIHRRKSLGHFVYLLPLARMTLHVEELQLIDNPERISMDTFMRTKWFTQKQMDTKYMCNLIKKVYRRCNPVPQNTREGDGKGAAV